jgi:hypothetical protein
MKGKKNLKRPATPALAEAKVEALHTQIKAAKTPCYESHGNLLPMDHFSDDVFELFVGDLFNEMKDQDEFDWYDIAHRFNGGADGGRDVLLHNRGVCVGAVQCKKYASNITLPMVLQELTKYFLHASFNTTMQPKEGEIFRWYLAASRGITTPGMEFLLSSGEEHLKNYRDQLNIAASTVRDSNDYLKTRPELANLTGEQLCDLIWPRLIKTQLGPLRDVELSKFALGLPSIISTYYQLRSIVTGDFSEIMSQISEMMNIPRNVTDDFGSATDIVSVFIPHTLLNGDSLNLVLLPASGQSALSALEEALVSRNRKVFTQDPVVIVTGATSFLPKDYTAIWQLLERATHPIILVGGCGTVKGKQLQDWQDDEKLILVENDGDILCNRHYQVGWCWTRLTQENIQCHGIISNVSADPERSFGKKQLCFIFLDVHFWPALGYDFFCGWDPARSLLRKLYMVTNDQNQAPKHIVALCADNANPTEYIRKAMANCHMLSERGKLSLIVCHNGMPDFGPSLRSLSGVFPGENKSRALMATKGIMTDGAILRSTQTDLASMTVNLLNKVAEVGVVDLCHLYQNKFIDDVPALFTELLNIVRNNKAVIPDGITPLAEHTLSQQYQIDNGLSAKILVHHTLEDLKPYTEIDPDSLDIMSDKLAILAELSSFLSMDEMLEWQTQLEQTGTLRWDESLNPIHIVAIESLRVDYNSVANQIVNWMCEPGEHPHLHVLSRARGHINEGLVVPEKYPRANWSNLSTTATVPKRDLTECVVARKASLGALNDLDDLYVNHASASEVHAFLLNIRRIVNE